ncbi:UNVERIFIED_CONTAM: N-terminal acetyltransferase B complex auxiliary subunit NAA25 [Sesamum calycinum]|uniref:N-terminal acetyltransferase B complex auxiliary subunit NAA25 n=1 Tax=Sesamum calycinum TaxID=2727403 RepID=A0AAW2SAE8_9LAMI
MVASPLWADLSDLLREYLKFMDDHFRESADLTFLAYRHRNYSKVIEFVQFKERLQRSSHYLMAKIEAPILQLKQNSNNIDEVECILESLRCGTHSLELSNEITSKSLTFNEDLKLRPWWTPTSDKNYLLESVKENLEANGALADSKLSLELKILLERYTNILDFPFQDAVELVFGFSSGQKPFEAPSPDLIDWMNFAVFLNARNLNSHEIKFSDTDPSSTSTWNLVNNMLRKYVTETIRCTGPVVSSPGSHLPFLVQLVTEPLAWHALIIHSCVRSLHPSGKKKKKGGSVDQSNTQLLHEIQNSIQSLCDTIEMVTRWLREQLNTPDDEKFEALFPSILRNGRNDGPGKVFKILESSSSLVKDVEVGARILEAVQSWSPAGVVRKIITGQRSLLSEFLKICELKLKSLQTVRLQL